MIRDACAADLAAIMRIERASFPSDAWPEAAMAAELASAHCQYLVCELAGVVTGYGGVRAAGPDADIQTIAIGAEHRGHGLGRALLRALLAEAQRREAREVFLDVRADNPAATALYASEGFVEIGRRARYYQPDDVDAVVMRLDLVGWAAANLVDNSADPHDSEPQKSRNRLEPLDSAELSTPPGACT